MRDNGLIYIVIGVLLGIVVAFSGFGLAGFYVISSTAFQAAILIRGGGSDESVKKSLLFSVSHAFGTFLVGVVYFLFLDLFDEKMTWYDISMGSIGVTLWILLLFLNSIFLSVSIYFGCTFLMKLLLRARTIKNS
jgi:hypothetical protein